jgi:hypothetical protein
MAKKASDKSCRFCENKGDLLILPLRYAVVRVSSAEYASVLPALSGTLGDMVTDIALKNPCIRYAVRPLRKGFLYLLLERNGIKRWRAFAVTDNAELCEFSPKIPPSITPEFGCKVAGHRLATSTIRIEKSADVQRAWLLFMPDAMTPAILMCYKQYVDKVDNADVYVAKYRMQAFSPAGWKNGAKEQLHALRMEQLRKTIAELIVQQKPLYANRLAKSLIDVLYPSYPSLNTPLSPGETHETLLSRCAKHVGSIEDMLRRNEKSGSDAAAFVLWDAIGIAQELNAFWSEQFGELAEWEQISKPVAPPRTGELDGATSLHRLQALNSMDEVREAAQCMREKMRWKNWQSLPEGWPGIARS